MRRNGREAETQRRGGARKPTTYRIARAPSFVPGRGDPGFNFPDSDICKRGTTSHRTLVNPRGGRYALPSYPFPRGCWKRGTFRKSSPPPPGWGTDFRGPAIPGARPAIPGASTPPGASKSPSRDV